MANVEVEGRSLQSVINLECDVDFQIYPERAVTRKTCEPNAEWTPTTKLSCVPSKINMVSV